jgi:hypothetical protein
MSQGGTCGVEVLEPAIVGVQNGTTRDF